jgi:hypothetical protein
MSCDRIAEALHHIPEKQLTGRNRLEGFETQISRPGTPSISFTRGDLYIVEHPLLVRKERE